MANQTGSQVAVRMRRFYWRGSDNFLCFGCYVVHPDLPGYGPDSDTVFYNYSSLGRRPEHPNLVWIDEPPDWAKSSTSGRDGSGG